MRHTLGVIRAAISARDFATAWRASRRLSDADATRCISVLASHPESAARYFAVDENHLDEPATAALSPIIDFTPATDECIDSAHDGLSEFPSMRMVAVSGPDSRCRWISAGPRFRPH
ncbi:MAG: hypothetical protein R2729_15255 [Bryobacteraceae bacterium]